MKDSVIIKINEVEDSTLLIKIIKSRCFVEILENVIPFNQRIVTYKSIVCVLYYKNTGSFQYTSNKDIFYVNHKQCAKFLSEIRKYY